LIQVKVNRPLQHCIQSDCRLTLSGRALGCRFMQYVLLEIDVAREQDRIDLGQKDDHPKGFAGVRLDLD
jgi:hypothetical protein